jgi:hypothetical protein
MACGETPRRRAACEMEINSPTSSVLFRDCLCIDDEYYLKLSSTYYADGFFSAR